VERIVVGVDGSPGAAAALAWALAEARTHGAELSVVSGFAYTDVVGVPGAMWPVDSYETLEAEARALVAEMVSDAGAADDPHVETRALFGNPAELLLDAARSADLLVVGSRGRGGFAGLLLGSVSQKCVTHGPCPVAVVPTPAIEG
jgi:nucleotide-binding universal stress UspA family protein